MNLHESAFYNSFFVWRMFGTTTDFFFYLQVLWRLLTFLCWVDDIAILKFSKSMQLTFVKLDTYTIIIMYVCLFI